MSKQAFKLKKHRRRWIALPKKRLVQLSILGLSILGAEPFTSSAGANDDRDSSPVIAHVQTAQFKIPFAVESHGNESLKVQLWVSVDDGATWQIQGSVPADAKSFDFRAASEGIYLFKVATIDSTGATFPNPGPPLQVLVDTTKPRSEIQADINEQGELVVDVRVADEHLDLNSARLRVRSDHESQWRELPLSLEATADRIYSGRVSVDLAPCRDVAIVFAIKDLSHNEGEATLKYSMPRTAAADREMTLASTKTPGQPEETNTAKTAPLQRPTIPGATRWSPSTPFSSQPTAQRSHNSESRAAEVPSTTSIASQPTAAQRFPSPGRLASEHQLSLDPQAVMSEELPLPPALTSTSSQPPSTTSAPFAPTRGPEGTDESRAAQLAPQYPPLTETPPRAADSQSLASSTIGGAFHCKSRAFSLDYSVEALGGSALADVELWGTEDGGRGWQKWGSDPDRISPFDVQVGNDGLFGFRMVIVGANGLVSNRPKEGDSADVWINIDTSAPQVRITRAVYGEGPEDGLLVIDYNCEDGHLVERPIALSYSERSEGPWTEIATGLTNTGIYLWKAHPTLPDKIYLKLECVDKAGNIGAHRLDLPIDIKGLAPRGIIQGFRAIEAPRP